LFKRFLFIKHSEKDVKPSTTFYKKLLSKFYDIQQNNNLIN